ncbi:P-loop NTPase [Spirochaeta africana]|uniref:ATPase involved in chromosome partitioning n=1 Tax=Spirochaeta africana (strain ATCC 700263 / DSM 8902 / Z-7692) TaxID=889378 RepID=H9UMR0_SPIAZ|nr:P-loop NTPase [Spirochaeta africana]AFG38803.1 ATPase involved in chromosome partitioning [Spirochaeta africana DSM 8902]
MHILPIASGKGGVGKSLVAANLAIALAQAGKRVVLVDLDLGGSNLHLVLGIHSVPAGIGNVIQQSSVQLNDVLMPTDYPNLLFIPGDAEIPGIANLNNKQKLMLLRRMKQLDADYVIIDLGAGTSFNTLDFFLSSSHGIIVTTPTPTAIVNAYLFLKNAVFRIITNNVKRKSPGGEYLERVKKEGTQLQRMNITTIMQQLQLHDPDSYSKVSQALTRFQPRMILNMLEDPKDAQKANRLRRSCSQYLDTELEHLGIIYRDDLQDVALSSRLPIISYKPNSVLSQALYRIADKVLQSTEDDEDLMDIQTIEESYANAGIEAEIDFQAKIDYIEDLLHAGALSTGDLIETIKNQQLEITQLKKQNMLYKTKLVKAVQQGYKI